MKRALIITCLLLLGQIIDRLNFFLQPKRLYAATWPVSLHSYWRQLDFFYLARQFTAMTAGLIPHSHTTHHRIPAQIPLSKSINPNSLLKSTGLNRPQNRLVTEQMIHIEEFPPR